MFHTGLSRTMTLIWQQWWLFDEETLWFMFFSPAILIFLYEVISWDVSVMPCFYEIWGTCFKFWLRPLFLMQNINIWLKKILRKNGSNYPILLTEDLLKYLPKRATFVFTTEVELFKLVKLKKIQFVFDVNTWSLNMYYHSFYSIVFAIEYGDLTIISVKYF